MVTTCADSPQRPRMTFFLYTGMPNRETVVTFIALSMMGLLLEIWENGF